MNTYTKKERLLALVLYRTAKETVSGASIEAALLLAADYARNGVDTAVIDELEYR